MCKIYNCFRLKRKQIHTARTNPRDYLDKTKRIYTAAHHDLVTHLNLVRDYAERKMRILMNAEIRKWNGGIVPWKEENRHSPLQIYLTLLGNSPLNCQ